MGVSAIFISYRREDVAGHAGRLAAELRSRSWPAKVFIDIDDIPAGVDFERRINETLRVSRVTLALIGDKWLTLQSKEGARRIDEDGDFVRREVAAALVRPEGIVIPVLIERTEMPSARDLPDDLAELAKRHAFKLGNERWRYDVERLCERIDEAIEVGRPIRVLRRARRNAKVAIAAVLVAAVSAIAAILASGGGSAGGLRVDDIPVMNSPAKYHTVSHDYHDVQDRSTKPSIELKIHNLGPHTADVTSVRFTVVDLLRIHPCFSAGGSPLSAVYDTTLPLTKGGVVNTVINEQVSPDQVDRFQVRFDLPLAAYGHGGLDSWLFRLHVELLHDAAQTPVDGGHVVLAFSGAPDPKDFASWWTKTSAANPGYAALVKTWGLSSIQCTIKQTPTVERFLALPGRRSPELTDFASQLTTAT